MTSRRVGAEPDHRPATDVPRTDDGRARLDAAAPCVDASPNDFRLLTVRGRPRRDCKFRWESARNATRAERRFSDAREEGTRSRIDAESSESACVNLLGSLRCSSFKDPARRALLLGDAVARRCVVAD